MTKHAKLVEKLLNPSSSFTFDELVSLLAGFGYERSDRGRTSGSSVMFFNPESGDKIMFHKPHPGKELKRYIIRLVIEKLRQNNMI